MARHFVHARGRHVLGMMMTDQQIRIAYTITSYIRVERNVADSVKHVANCHDKRSWHHRQINVILHTLNITRRYEHDWNIVKRAAYEVFLHKYVLKR